MIAVENKVPALRFPEFSKDWKTKTLEEIAEVNPKSDTLPESFKYIDLESVVDGLIVKEDIVKADNAPSRAQRLLQNNDILFQTVRPYQKNNLFFNKGINYVASTGYAQLRASEDPKYLYYFLHTDQFVKTVLFRCTGTSYPAINSSELSTIPVAIPSLPEQQKIASFLTAVDAKIELLTKKKTLLEQYKKGVMQQLFSQEIRFKDDIGKDFPDWKEMELKDFLTQTLREVNKPNVPYLAIGVRSHCKGTFQKPNSEPDSIAMESLYKVAENDLIVNITFAWEGAIALVKKEDQGGLVSHRFPTYVFNEELVTHRFFKYVFSQKKFVSTLELISPGGAGRNRVLNKNTFLKIKWSLPVIEEQIKIAEFLSGIDSKIENANKQLELTKTYKKSLFQQLFV